MARLKVLASGSSPQAKAQARGKLFEKLMADVLRHYGFSIDRLPAVNYAGMEIDIEGKHSITTIPLYAECKCYETELAAPSLQEFFGKYMARWLKDQRCQGLFIALPGINTHAKGFYRDNCESDDRIVIRLLEEPHVLEAIFSIVAVTRPENISRLITTDVGIAGDWLLLYTDRGFYWVQYIIRPGSGVASGIALFDASGSPLSNGTTIDYLVDLYPELDDFDKITIGSPIAIRIPTTTQDIEQIVEVIGSSACFEYQFPASPEFFVGRETVLTELDAFLSMVINKETSSRGILFEANSGWGKSSTVLATVSRMNRMGHLAVAIDSRSASSSQFILRVVDYVRNQFREGIGSLANNAQSVPISGFEGATQALLDTGGVLKQKNKVLFIFLDQFENVFFLPDTLRRIRDLFLQLCDAQTNVVLGFSWKTDLVGMTGEFPYRLRDTIAEASKRIALSTFTEAETNGLLDRLSSEMRASLRKDLRFFLSEFSQGYPWLLKKLCAHVKAQRESGVPQADIANSLLNVEELFQEDLRGLSIVEEDALRRIARAAPIPLLELGEEFRPEVVQSLIDRRLVVRIGVKYDIYWDIFRDYLNVGRVPIQENYILRMQVGTILKATRLLADANGVLSTSEFQQQFGLSDQSLQSFYNVARDMRLLGLAKVEEGTVKLQSDLILSKNAFEDTLRSQIRDRLTRNRLVSRLIETLQVEGTLSTFEVAALLAEWCPYTSAADQTWHMYARIFAGWIDFTDLAIYNSSRRVLTSYLPGAEVRKRNLLLPKRRSGVIVPPIQYTPVEKIAITIVRAAQGKTPIDWSGFTKSTVAKSLLALEDIGFIARKAQSIEVSAKGLEFVLSPERRPELFAEGALKMSTFSTFIDVLKGYKGTSLNIVLLGNILRERLEVDWTDETTASNVKIMLNWARYTDLAPTIFDRTRSKEVRSRRAKNLQTTYLPEN